MLICVYICWCLWRNIENNIHPTSFLMAVFHRIHERDISIWQKSLWGKGGSACSWWAWNFGQTKREEETTIKYGYYKLWTRYISLLLDIDRRSYIDNSESKYIFEYDLELKLKVKIKVIENVKLVCQKEVTLGHILLLKNNLEVYRESNSNFRIIDRG